MRRAGGWLGATCRWRTAMLPFLFVYVLALLGLGCTEDHSFSNQSSTQNRTAPKAADADADMKPTVESVDVPTEIEEAILPVEAPSTGPTITAEEQAAVDRLKRLPKFGLLVNDMECGMCHVSVIGSVVSTRTVPPFWTGSNLAITGRWLLAGDFLGNVPAPNDPNGLGVNVTVSAAGGLLPKYGGPELPLDINGDGVPDFPTVDFAALPGKMRGFVATTDAFAAQVSLVHEGNLVLVGTAIRPIVIMDDVLVTGDLVIKGWFTGIGTLYVRGNIYIPADLKAVNSAFPYPDSDAAATALAAEQMKVIRTDAIGLATAKSIFIGDLEKHQNSEPGLETLTVYNHSLTPLNRQGATLGVLKVFDWFPGGRAGFDQLYENAVSCETGAATQLASFNLVEAFLYAQNTVAGISRRASYSIRGGVVADYFHVISGASRCGNAAPSTVHGRPQNRSYIEYDYRLQTGLLRILQYAGEKFPKP